MAPMATDQRRAILARTLPFALFMAFIALEEGARVLIRHGWLPLSEISLYYLYPVKTVLVAATLCRFFGEYQELTFKECRVGAVLATCLVGVLTFIIWIAADWTVPVTGPPPGFDPTVFGGESVRVLLTAFRVAGAVLVVPLMEELFWRSFLLRYLIDPCFERVPVGRFTWPSFAITTVLFGTEHHLIVAGMLAGAIYSFVLYRTKSLAHCVIAHAVTNLVLAAYVLQTGRWDLW